ncbi:MarR family transcriptional regulator [Desulfovibrio sp. OttesenSCG-928-A18]|nr:MarR family transcriptional regulator [Desulfovibrio sp. OttesenSCG-928-A18]
MNDVFYEMECSLGFMTISTNRLMSALMRKRLVEAGVLITAEQWGVMAMLWNEDGQSQDALAWTLCVDKSSLSRVLDVMERKNLICRVRDPDDARRKIVYASKESKKLRQICREVAQEANSEMLQGISSGDLETCLNVMKQIKQTLRSISE